MNITAASLRRMERREDHRRLLLGVPTQIWTADLLSVPPEYAEAERQLIEDKLRDEADHQLYMSDGLRPVLAQDTEILSHELMEQVLSQVCDDCDLREVVQTVRNHVMYSRPDPDDLNRQPLSRVRPFFLCAVLADVYADDGYASPLSHRIFVDGPRSGPQ